MPIVMPALLHFGVVKAGYSDVASLELNVAALARGYDRPAGKAHELTLSVVQRPARLRPLSGLSR